LSLVVRGGGGERISDGERGGGGGIRGERDGGERKGGRRVGAKGGNR